MEELRECPFCGSQRVMIGRTPIHHYQVLCPDCGIRTAWGTEQIVVACWNKRAADDEIEALEEMLKLYDDDDWYNDAVANNARAALAKAKGGVACSR